MNRANIQLVYRGKEDGKRDSYKTVVDKIRTWRGEGDPYSGDREPDVCGLSYGTAEYADRMLKLPETVEREESCTCTN